MNYGYLRWIMITDHFSSCEKDKICIQKTVQLEKKEKIVHILMLMQHPPVDACPQ